MAKENDTIDMKWLQQLLMYRLTVVTVITNGNYGTVFNISFRTIFLLIWPKEQKQTVLST